ncbi:MAG TPA: ATP-dependent helicase [Plantibacter sp.]|uniref:ATP-dependent helicase n=1 Tax=unclassified Plantibacter TaxID=2624265 RepID=UPI002C60E00A|nr:ATP-dependent helicase [Plantibacter sp.]
MNTSSELLAGLDPDQAVAAEALRGPVCMLAGAGTGKTRAITHRIAYGVATGTYTASRVMALTFTSRAAAELRGRLRALGAEGVSARTFHASALSQLNFFWPQVVGGQVPGLVESKGRVLGHAAERLRLRVDTATLRDVAAEIEWRKVSGLTFEQYATAGRPLVQKLSLEQVIALQETYEQLKDERKRIDFEDVLLACAGMIESEPAVAMQVHEQYRFFVVDEYQDVSPLQHRLLELWLGGRRDVCVVGDASQTIYSFAGARADYLLDFPSRYSDATVVRLERNYRSSQPVVAAANTLMRGRPGALQLSAVRREAENGTDRPDSPAVGLRSYPNELSEARGVVSEILMQLQAGVQASEIAVLYRINVQAAALETALGEAGVPFVMHGSKRFFELPEVRQALLQLRAASVSIMGEPLFKSVSDVLRSLGWSQDPPDGGGAVRDRWESLNAIMGLVDQAPEGTTFRAFTDELLTRQAAQHEPTVEAVTLATLHSAKGLEWEAVHLIGLSEGYLPISYAKQFEQADEERRLLYVGITRAKRLLNLSWAETQQRGGRREPSRFLAELGMRTSSVPGRRGV